MQLRSMDSMLKHHPHDYLPAAGHDARHLAKVCPAAMIFIPCRDGVSHVEHEWAKPEHVAAGAFVLAQVLRDLALADPPSVAEA